MEDNNNGNTVPEEETRTPNMTPYSESELAEVVEWSHNYNSGRRGGQEGENVITNITLHIVDGDWGAGGFKGFAHTDRPASSNYGIASDGTIVQMVSEANTPWTNGGSDSVPLPNPVGSGTVGYNTNSVTIEISNLRVINKTGPNTFVATDGKEYNFKVEDGQTLIEMNGNYYRYPITNAALDSTIRLVADIAKRNNLGELYHDGYNGTLTWHRDFPGVYKACPGDYVIAMTDYICESANSINQKGYYIPDYAIESDNALMGIVLSTESNPFDSGTVAADMYSTVSSINNIRNAVGAVEVQSPTYTSTSTIPGNLMNAETSLLGISNDLNGTILNETKVISSIAQVFFDMDRERTAAASALSDGSELNFDESGYTAMLNDLLAFDVTGELKFDSFKFDPFSHTEGNSGKICLSDLNSMLSGGSLAGPLHDNLESERQSAKATLTELDNLNTMISSGTNFQGDIWKAVSGRLTEYSELMNLRIESADKLEAAMAKAIKLIIDYMGEYEELDDSKLPELKEKAEQIKQSILDAENIINATHNVSVPVDDGNGGTTYKYVIQYVYSASARTDAKNYITQARSLLIEINKEINKLENLPIVLAEAEQIINDALIEIYGSYGTRASNAVTGKTVSYIPPQNTNYVAPAYKPVEKVSTTRVIEGKVDQGRFYMTPALQAQYGSYEDYLNNVLKENNPMYNHELEDNGIEPGQSLDDKIFEDEPENPDDTTDTPETGDDVGDNPEDDKPETPGDTTPETPGDTTPETPGDTTPETPGDTTPETPGDTTPETPGDTTPETPGDTTPETPGDTTPETPGDTTPETPGDTTPETPGDTTPETPGDTTPETPGDTTPETPGDTTPEDTKPDTPSEPKPEKPATKPNVDEKPSSPVIPNVPGTDDTPGVTPDIPSEPDIDIPPIVEIPDDDFITPDIPAIDDTPVIDDKPIDITPPNVKDEPSGNDNGIDLAKAIGISLGAGAAVGAAALGAHTVKKAKENNIYEDE
ncbi:MAG: N-acetylmuramoyl-L-alanine amidase [Bacilli bacterium]|nr:N-acetylmuramoyl-L-alanine amidase [Bacilli bacterium]